MNPNKRKKRDRTQAIRATYSVSLLISPETARKLVEFKRKGAAAHAGNR